MVHSAGVQDRDGAPDVLKAVAARHPMLRHTFADGGYAGPKLREAAKAIRRWTIQKSSKFCPADGSSSALWLGSVDAAVSMDWEKSVASVAAWVTIDTSDASHGTSQRFENTRIVLNQILSKLLYLVS